MAAHSYLFSATRMLGRGGLGGATSSSMESVSSSLDWVMLVVLLRISISRSVRGSSEGLQQAECRLQSCSPAGMQHTDRSTHNATHGQQETPPAEGNICRGDSISTQSTTCTGHSQARFCCQILASSLSEQIPFTWSHCNR